MKQREDADTAATSAGPLELLGLFPAFHVDNAGGIQVSGELAWDAVVRACAADGKRAHALQVDLSHSAHAGADPHSTLAQTRLNAALQVLRARWSPNLILCWHADLIRLIPLVRGSDRRILFLHGIEAWQETGWVKQRLLGALDLILVNSAFTLERARRAAPVLQRVRAEIVPLGIGTPLGNPPGPPEVPSAAIMIGRLDHGERYKGHEAVIEAWPRVLERLPDARLWIVGDGGLRADLQSQVNALNLTGHITFFGRVDEQAKEALLLRSRCLLLPSRAEGFGLVYLEAMRAGRPSLVSVHDAGREV
ncbi:MAG: glycosyltransferase family 4 protein, partial [Gemmatimonadota bacterium]